ncbi:M16 family metallopeptidase [Paraclostridium sordellii]|uniref:M16 family peptidase n=1 Tax=Paraclostridium sordellii TaxID=1505 RepID=A0A0C7I1N3_PARSO|nr:pitrilysin family protein [Paeniclostridium sordellii]QYE98721.1 insulinase family protein [Paeniclostridium sordellii]CEN77488.1 M16 family peptidase [[Clostridium] sordellii] [Paeniclostridium sordellii]CEO05950.1 M16 family peptidase [[Clostridium] sordellii] [Paeniclostridium sordellii]CEP86298.1 M16 family peptidase [[Clostridium] sordellii] [Paeniclostridium sordellii]CEP96550.1 M16 family peptidase [[Clostridium] sordellii] [Paeniclostridium sordellii]
MYKIHTLDNGLTIVGEEIPYLKSITLGVWVNAGSRIESEKLSGISHFIEHMLFKGTKNRTSKEIASTIDNLGGQINAFTSKECTCYYVKLLDEHIDIGLDILSDMFLNPLFDKEDIEKERQVILEELKMYEDSPEDLVYDLLMEGVYKTDALGGNIIGTKESLDNMNREIISDYFKKYYVASNSVISISGNFKFEEIVKLIEEKFKNVKKGDVDIEITTPEFHPCFIAKNKETEQVNLAISLKAIPLEDREDAYALSIINNIFGGSISSRLFQNIRENKGLVYSIYSAPSLYRKSGELGIYASMSNENLKKVYNLVLEEIDNIRENHLTEEEIRESKEQLKGSYILGLESTSSRMMSIGKSMLLTKKVKDPNDIIESINNIEKARIDLIIDKVFNKENIGICIVGRDVESITLD